MPGTKNTISTPCLKAQENPLHVLIPLLRGPVDHKFMDLFLNFLSCSIDQRIFFIYNNTLLFLLQSLYNISEIKKWTLPALFFFIYIILAIWGLFWFYTNWRIILSVSVKRKHWNFYKGLHWACRSYLLFFKNKECRGCCSDLPG